MLTDVVAPPAPAAPPSREAASTADGMPVPGDRVGFYEVQELIGAGGFGVLYRATRDGMPFALKVAHQRLSLLPPEERRICAERMEREALALMSVRHPNIVRIHGFDRWPNLQGFPILVMEFVEGLRLDVWQRKTSASLRHIARVFAKLAQALHALHGKGLVHRDVKADNVLVRPHGEPILVDFGISRPALGSALTQPRVVVGTPTHLPPEYVRAIAEGRGSDSAASYGPRADLYSLGVMLYHLLAGRLPYGTSGASPLKDALNRARPQSLRELHPGIPQSLEDIAFRLLEKKPEDRHPSGHALAQALEQALNDKGADWDAAYVAPRLSPPSPLATPNVRSPSPAPAQVQPSVEVSVEVLPDSPPPPADAKPAPEPKPSDSFALPSQAMGFEAPDAPAPVAPERPAPVLPSLLVRARQRLLEAEVASKRKTPRLLLVGGGLLVAVMALLALMASGDTDEGRNLLEPPDAKVAAPAAQAPAAPRAPAITAPRPARSDAASIERMLAEAYGGRPIILPDGTVKNMSPVSGPSWPPAAPPMPAATSSETTSSESAAPSPRPPPLPSGPEWLRRGEMVAPAQSEAQGDAPLGVPMGTRLKVKLRGPLDSRTVGFGPIEARVIRPLVIRGRVVVPARTVLFGEGRASMGRFHVRFNRLRLPTGREVQMEALAYDLGDGQPGLRPSRTMAGSTLEGAGMVEEMAKGAAGIVLTTVGGNTPKDLARGAGETALRQRDSATGSYAGEVLVLEGGIAETVLLQSF